MGESWASALYKFLVKHKDVGGLQLIKKQDIFLNPPLGGAIACVDGRDIKQVLLCEFREGTCFTRGVMGDFGEHSVDVFDILCAVCSSSDPIITKHRMVIQPNHIETMKALWPKTRLGMMSVEERWAGIAFYATIGYPS